MQLSEEEYLCSNSKKTTPNPQQQTDVSNGANTYLASASAPSLNQQSTSKRPKEELYLEEKELYLEEVDTFKKELEGAKKELKKVVNLLDPENASALGDNLTKMNSVLKGQTRPEMTIGAYIANLETKKVSLEKEEKELKDELKKAIDKLEKIIATSTASTLPSTQSLTDQFKIKIDDLYMRYPGNEAVQKEIDEFIQSIYQYISLGLCCEHLNPEKQAKILGALNNLNYQFPIIKEKIDMRLFTFDPSNSGKVTRLAALEMNEAIKDRVNNEKDGDYYFFVAVSGSGKTSTIFDLARENYVIYIQCTDDSITKVPNQGTNATVYSNSKESRFSDPDQGFIVFNSTFKNQINSGASTPEQKYEIGRKVVAAYFLSKLFLLCQMFKDLKRKPTSLEYLIQQINSRTNDHHLFNKFSGWDYLQIEKTFALLKLHIDRLFQTKVNFVLAIDEIEVASGMSIEAHRSKSNIQNIHETLLNIMANTASMLMSVCNWDVIFAGTGTTHDKSETLLSSIGKIGTPVNKYSQNYFPMATANECKQILFRLELDNETKSEIERIDDFERKIWNMDECNKIHETIQGYLVGARFRLLTGSIERINTVQSNEKWKAAAPKDILHESIRESIRNHMHRLTQNINLKISKRFDENLITHVQEKYLQYLCYIYAAASLTNGVITFPHEHSPMKTETDLLQIGVAGGFQIDSKFEDEADQLSVIITEISFLIIERFVIEAIAKLIKNYQNLAVVIQKKTFQEILGLIRSVRATFGPTITMKGNLVESAILNSFEKLKENCITVQDLPFIKHGCYEPTDSNNLKRWKRVKFGFNSTHVEGSKIQLMKGDQNDIGRLANSIFVTFSPDITCRPDGIIMLPNLYDDGKDYKRAIVIGCAVYGNNVPKEKQESQMRSTDLSRSYLKDAVNEVNDDVKRELWLEYGLHKTRSIRIEVCLPQPENSSKIKARDVKRIGNHKKSKKEVQLSNGSKRNETVYEIDENDKFEFSDPGNNDLIVKLDMNNIHHLIGISKEKNDPLDCLYQLLAIATRTDVEKWPGSFYEMKPGADDYLHALVDGHAEGLTKLELEKNFKDNDYTIRDLERAISKSVNENNITIESGIYKSAMKNNTSALA